MTEQATIAAPTNLPADEKLYRTAATQLWGGNELEIDSDAEISASASGAWVHAWVWVSKADAGIEKESKVLT